VGESHGCFYPRPEESVQQKRRRDGGRAGGGVPRARLGAATRLLARNRDAAAPRRGAGGDRRPRAHRHGRRAITALYPLDVPV
jgi:hypothetical protein